MRTRLVHADAEAVQGVALRVSNQREQELIDAVACAEAASNKEQAV